MTLDQLRERMKSRRRSPLRLRGGRLVPTGEPLTFSAPSPCPRCGAPPATPDAGEGVTPATLPVAPDGNDLRFDRHTGRLMGSSPVGCPTATTEPRREQQVAQAIERGDLVTEQELELYPHLRGRAAEQRVHADLRAKAEAADAVDESLGMRRLRATIARKAGGQ